MVFFFVSKKIILRSVMKIMKAASFLKSLGPGLLFAGAAVGVSHLVQSTRAGAGYGFELVWVVIIANALKYPFMEFGPRYANATGNSLVEGYRTIGRWALVLYVLLTVSTMFAIQAAVSIVTAGLFATVFGLHMPVTWITAIILLIAMIVLGVGRYEALDKIIKFVIITLAISTLVAVLYAFGAGYFKQDSLSGNFDWNSTVDLLFLIAFVGWMPAPIDVSVWHSLWSVAKVRQLGHRPSMKQVLTDFNIGYIGAAVLALLFLSLGALVMFGSGQELSEQGIVFSQQLISMYTSSIGPWAYWLIAIAALTTMVSTTITCLDAYPRVMRSATQGLMPRLQRNPKSQTSLYWFWIVIVTAGTLLLMSLLKSSMAFMVDLATTISFVTAPALAILNYRVIMHTHVPAGARPRRWLRIYAVVGIVFLSAFSLFYILWRLFIH
jgi:Mn2+/Fe2+ NRAMP family transporter